VKGILPRRDDIAAQFEAVAGVDAQVLEFAVAETRLVGCPGAVIYLAAEESAEDV
jgi:hypothetical protein